MVKKKRGHTASQRCDAKHRNSQNTDAWPGFACQLESQAQSDSKVPLNTFLDPNILSLWSLSARHVEDPFCCLPSLCPSLDNVRLQKALSLSSRQSKTPVLSRRRVEKANQYHFRERIWESAPGQGAGSEAMLKGLPTASGQQTERHARLA
ncbi:hypothetical protein NliqN6_2293 [Naganishia liquefaciens]|uniref:Uncharacterized protein n=1 Tax=Naganishia liquefaciens TaxID=104408 RepID=A0A8H3TR41_9TREE|nr:hypothetical protein NliqN6_2293 [Naganishia liquefaciens]